LEWKKLRWLSDSRCAMAVGMEEIALVVGFAVRDGVECYALSGLDGIWPSWIVEAA